MKDILPIKPTIILVFLLAMVANASAQVTDCIDYEDINPRLIKYQPTGNPVTDMAISGSYLFLAEGNAGVGIWDVSDFEDPVYRTTLAVDSIVREINIVGDYAYLSCYDPDVLIVDISNPITPKIVGTIEIAPQAWFLGAFEQLAFIATYYGLTVVDISDPTNPFVAGSFDVTLTQCDISLIEDIAYICDTRGIYSLDISDPSNPIELDRITNLGWAWSMMVQDGIAYLNSSYNYGSAFDKIGQFNVIDISDPFALKTLGYAATEYSSFGDGILKIDDRIFVSGGSGGLQVYDVSQPHDPRFVGRAEADRETTTGGIATLNSAIFTCHRHDGFNVYDTAQISLADAVEIPGSNFDFALGDDLIFVAAGHHTNLRPQREGVQILTRSETGRTSLVSSYIDEHTYQHIEAYGTTAYAADISTGITVIDASMPSNPTETVRINTPGTVQDMVREGDFLFVAVDTAGIQIYSIDTPLNPQLVTTLRLPAPVGTLQVQGKTICTGSSSGPLSVIDWTNPANPIVTGVLELEGETHVLEMRDAYAYGTTENYGQLFIFNTEKHTMVKVVPGAFDSDRTVGLFVDLEIVGDRGYAVDLYDRMFTIDFSDLEDPQIDGLVEILLPWKLIASATNLYVLGSGFWGEPGRLYRYPVECSAMPPATETHDIPSHHILAQNFPNPFNPSTEIQFSLTTRQTVSLAIYDVRGHLVRNLITTELRNIGTNTATWNGRNNHDEHVSAGIYFYRLSLESSTKTRRMTLLK